eukprot:3826170-Rhodomonas_salina.1
MSYSSLGPAGLSEAKAKQRKSGGGAGVAPFQRFLVVQPIHSPIMWGLTLTLKTFGSTSSFAASGWTSRSCSTRQRLNVGALSLRHAVVSTFRMLTTAI